MKVAFIHFYTFRLLRGIETLIISLANELAHKGIDVSILSAHPTLKKTLIPLDRKVKVKEFPTFRYFEYQTIAPFYAYDVIKNKYDIVNIFFADFGEAAAIRIASKFVNFKLNLYLCYPLQTAPHRFKSIKKFGIDKMADCIIADSHFVAEGAEQFFQRPCTVIPAGTDVERFKPDAELRKRIRQQLKIDSDEVVMLNVSELEERKGVQRLVEILPIIQKNFPKIRYIILGNGRYQSVLQKMIKDLNLTDCVQFLGTTTDLVDFYNAADIFVMLPDYEANSIACHEAMGCGLPVIASNTGGFKEVVNKSCGRLVNIYSQEEVISAILELARNADLRRDLGKEGRNVIQKSLTWHKISDQLIKVFKQELTAA